MFQTQLSPFCAKKGPYSPLTASVRSGLCCRTLFRHDQRPVPYLTTSTYTADCTIHPHLYHFSHPFFHPFFISSPLNTFDTSLVLSSMSIFQNVRMTAGERQMISVLFTYLFIHFLHSSLGPAFPPACAGGYRGDVYVYKVGIRGSFLSFRSLSF